MKKIGFVFVLIGLIAACNPSGTPSAEEKTVIEKTIRDSIGWALTKDRPLLESVMAHDPKLLIINPDSAENTVGWDNFVKGFDFWMDPRFKATGLDIRDMRIDVSPSGDTAWWYCVVDDLAEWEGAFAGWKEARWTGVLEKKDGKWQIIQNHFSFPSNKVIAEARARMQEFGAEPLKAALEYVEGRNEGNAARVEQVLHPRFSRIAAGETAASANVIHQENRAQFLDNLRRGKDKTAAADPAQIKTAVRDFSRAAAVVRVDSPLGVEYLNLVKLGDRWLVISVLWERPAEEGK